MTDHSDYLPGTFVVIETNAPAKPSHPLARAMATLLDDLGRIPVPRINCPASAEEFEEVADHIERVARICDRWLVSVGEEVQANASPSPDMSVFTDQFLGAVQGNATFECERVAEGIREDDRSEARRSRYSGMLVDRLRDLGRS